MTLLLIITIGFCSLIILMAVWECYKKLLDLEELIKSDQGAVISALLILYEETANYIRINKLGDLHHNRSMQAARDILEKVGAKKKDK